MPNKHSRRLSLRSWLAALFRQPPAGFYRTPSIYQSGRPADPFRKNSARGFFR